MTSQPIAFSPALETREDGEDETSLGLRTALRDIEETTSKDYGHAVRSVHAKGHALVEGHLTVKDGLPPEFAQGLFAKGGEYRVIARFSTAPGDILDDSVSTPRGLALKILGVEGEREASAEDATQDFVMVDGPAFGAPKAKAFLANLKMLAKTTDKAEGLKKILSAVLRGTETVLETVGMESATIKTLGGVPSVHPLGQSYFSQTAFRYGDHVAKFSLAPVSPTLTELTGSKVAMIGRPDALREVCGEVFIENPTEWSLRVQLCVDAEKMPIEDPSVVWDEELSPFVEVARLRVEPQPSWEHGKAEGIEDSLSFSPWHCLSAHRPLGVMNRVRREAYEMSAGFRGDFNKCPMHEPRALEVAP